VRVVVAGQPQPVVRISGAPFAVRVARWLLLVIIPSRWSAWRVLLSKGGVRLVVAGQPQPVVRMAGAPSLAYTDALTDMCIHGICRNLSAMPGLRGISPLGSGRGHAGVGCIV
jgi:hypothetical protein